MATSIRLYEILSRELETAILGGLRKAAKHNVKKEEDVAEYVHQYVMLALTEVFDFGEGE